MFSTKGCTACGMLTFVTVYACLCFCYVKGQTVGHLSCPEKWTRGDNIQLFCVINIAEYNTECFTPVNETYFSLNGTTQCTIEDTDFKQCSSPSPVSKPGCRCETNGTHHIFKYSFTALEVTHSGSWACQRRCTKQNGLEMALNVSSDSSCTTVVLDREEPEPENRDGEIGGAAAGGTAGGAAAGGLAAVLYYLFGKDKIRCLQYKKGKRPTNEVAIKELTEAAKKVMTQVQGVFIYTVFDIQNVVYVMILGTKPANLDEAEKKMLSTVQCLEKCPVPKESREPGDSRDPKPDYPGSNASGQ